MTRAASPLDLTPPRTTGSALVASAAATVVHVGLVAIAAFVGAELAGRETNAPTVSELVDVQLPPEVPPPDVPVAAPVSKPNRAEPQASPDGASASRGAGRTRADRRGRSGRFR